MRLHEMNVVTADRSVRVTAVVEWERAGTRIEPYIEYGVEPEHVGHAADAFAAAMLLPAMRAGETLRIEPPLSPRLCTMLPRIRDVFHAWWPHLARVDIDVTPEKVLPLSLPRRAATFFSGGVDSFYSLLKHHSGHGPLPVPMTHVIFVRGVETRLEFIRGVEDTQRWVREIAAGTCGNVIVGESNFRAVLQGPPENLHWEHHYYGSALAAIALGLSAGFTFVCVPSGYSYNHLSAHGSTPLVDEMYSTERLQVLHDGAETSRANKVARILEWDRDLVLKHLRVCIENRGGAHNCGRCKKCVRTAVPLRVLGAWEDASTFPNKDTAHWERVMEQDHVAFSEENLLFAQEHGADPALIAMIARVIKRRRRRETVKALTARPPLDRLQPMLRSALKLWKFAEAPSLRGH